MELGLIDHKVRILRRSPDCVAINCFVIMKLYFLEEEKHFFYAKSLIVIRINLLILIKM